MRERNAYVRLVQEYAVSDMVSSCLYQNGKAMLCRLISFDIDRDKSAKHFWGDKLTKRGVVRLCHKKIRSAIVKNFPDLAPFISYIVKSQGTGLNLVICFPAFEVNDVKLGNMALMAQKRIARMLQSIGIGVDDAALGMLQRDVPNFQNRHLRVYRNKKRRHQVSYISRRDANGNPIIHILSDLLGVLQRWKPIWDEGKKTNCDRYLYPDQRIELKMADFLLRTELEFSVYASQAELAQAMNVCVKTVRRLMTLKLSWISIEMTADKKYLVHIKRNSPLLARAKMLVSGKTGSFKDWRLPHASEIKDGERNEYIWRMAVILRDQNFDIFKSNAIIADLLKMMPGHEGSRNAKNYRAIVRSIWKNGDCNPMSKAGSCGKIEGLQQVIEALGTKSWKVLAGDGGVYQDKTERRKPKLTLAYSSSHQPSIFNLESSPYVSKIQSTGRVTESLEDRSQYKLQRQILDQYLSPLLETFFHRNSFAYRTGKGTVKAQAEICELKTRHQHWMKFDVSKFFESIDHKILHAKLSDITGTDKANRLIAAVTAPRIVDQRLCDRTRGIATGSSLSPCLSNLYLTHFDFYLQSLGLDFVRQADDVVIFGTQRHLLKSFRLIVRYLDSIGLKISLGKTKVSWK